MDFSSDNAAGASPEILAAIAAANRGTAAAYGADAITALLTERFAALFEHEVAVFPVATGTAANALALAALAPPWGIVYCHEEAHIALDECGAPEFFAGGAKLMPLPGEHAKITPYAVARRLTERGFVHHAQPASISISQSSEAGTLYGPPAWPPTDKASSVPPQIISRRCPPRRDCPIGTRPPPHSGRHGRTWSRVGPSASTAGSTWQRNTRGRSTA